jgi:hypothetical protein
MAVPHNVALKDTVRVLVAVDPFLFRTALHHVVSLDDRFEVVLLPSGASIPPVALDHGSPPVVLTTQPVDLPGACVLAFDPITGDVRVVGDGQCARHRYEDLDALCELLHRVVAPDDVPLPEDAGGFGEPVPTRRRGD